MEIVNRRTETIEKQGDKFPSMTSAKCMRSWLSGQIGKFAKQKSPESFQAELILRGVQNAYNHFHPEIEKLPKVIEITLEGWKGEGQIDIYKGFTNDFIIIEHIKDKETGEVKQLRKEISKVNVNTLLFIIKKWGINENHSCYELSEMLGWDWKELWKERKKYFEIYYYPIKVLEKIGIINYGGRGKITRIK